MRVGIAFAVTEPFVLRDACVKEARHVACHIRVEAFVDGKAAGGVGAVDDQHAVLPAVFGHGPAKGGGDVEHFLPGAGGDKELFHVQAFFRQSAQMP